MSYQGVIVDALMGRVGLMGYKMFKGDSSDSIFADFSVLKAGGAALSTIAPYVGGVVAVMYFPRYNPYLTAMAGGAAAYFISTKLSTSA